MEGLAQVIVMGVLTDVGFVSGKVMVSGLTVGFWVGIFEGLATLKSANSSFLQSQVWCQGPWFVQFCCYHKCHLVARTTRLPSLSRQEDWEEDDQGLMCGSCWKKLRILYRSESCSKVFPLWGLPLPKRKSRVTLCKIKSKYKVRDWLY